MKTYAPDYYKNFSCLAGDCKHSCCKGWEVDIDEKTIDYYRSVEGEMGKRLKNAISYEGAPHFTMTKEGDCPFLNSCGLCDIMINLGFDKVSYICNEHPRFYKEYSDRTEVGLGLSCEAVAALILSKNVETCLECIQDDGDELLWEDECDLLDLRDDIFDILQNRDYSMADRLNELSDFAGEIMPYKNPRRWAEFFLSLERLEHSWTDILTDLKTARFKNIRDEWFEIALEQLAVYFIFRHFPDGYSDDDTAYMKAAMFAIVSVGMIQLICSMENARKGIFTIEDMAEICRMYSAEIEYNEDNVRAVMTLWDKGKR